MAADSQRAIKIAAPASTTRPQSKLESRHTSLTLAKLVAEFMRNSLDCIPIILITAIPEPVPEKSRDWFAASAA